MADGLYGGSQAGAATAAALNSGTPLKVKEILVQNDPDSAGSLLVGGSNGQAYQLEPDDEVSVEIDDVAKVYIKLASGSAATANWLATR